MIVRIGTMRIMVRMRVGEEDEGDGEDERV